jgi:hypothetical protein
VKIQPKWVVTSGKQVYKQTICGNTLARGTQVKEKVWNRSCTCIGGVDNESFIFVLGYTTFHAIFYFCTPQPCSTPKALPLPEKIAGTVWSQ